VTLVLDSGALIALERADRRMWRRLKAALLAEDVPLTHAGIIAQVWRGDGPRQSLLARALAGIEVRPIDLPVGRAAGELLAATKGSDVIDAALVLIALDGDDIVTSDPDDIEPLAGASQRHVELIRT
jgi:hypothetical protein